MSRFQSIEDIRTFCGSVADLAAALGDEWVSRMLWDALARGNTQPPTERLGETLIGFEAALEVMDERYPSDVIAEIREAIGLGRDAIRRPNGPWPDSGVFRSSAGKTL